MAENLWALREQKRLSVATLATRAGLPIGLIMEYESGQRSIDPRHLNRIARALYVEESDIRLESEARPGTAPLERQARKEGPRPAAAPPPAAADPAAAPPARSRERQGRAPRGMQESRPPAPARPSQIAHLQTLLARLGRTEESVETDLGKPLSEIGRFEASKLLVQLQADLKNSTAERHRPYLPEAVDQHELRYLTAARDAEATLHFRLFDNSELNGKLTGFGPYSITIQQSDGSETTLNKLAIVSYTRFATRTENANGKEPRQ